MLLLHFNEYVDPKIKILYLNRRTIFNASLYLYKEKGVLINVAEPHLMHLFYLEISVHYGVVLCRFLILLYH